VPISLCPPAVYGRAGIDTTVKDKPYKHRYLVIAVGLILVGVIVLITERHLANHSNRLWQIVHEQCVPDQEQHGDPSPCALVNLQDGVERGYAILKDLVGATQYLLLPTTFVSGIESPDLLLPNTRNYFAAAWRERGYVERATGRTLPRAAISLAVNSPLNRSQNHLHIHMDCVRLDVQATLQRALGGIGDDWAVLPELLVGHTYRARRIVAEDLTTANPFVLLADGVPDARSAMGAQTLTVIGAQFADGKPGFVVLNARINLGSGAFIRGEELQDHSCAAARG
jgi:CDP-diacylglycerol pyrophosphatase